MPEQVNIASLTINVDDVIKESAKLKRQIDALKKSQKDLDSTTEEGSEAFAQNEIKLKKLSKAYRDNQQFATALDEANEDLVKTMQVEGKSTQELRDSRRQLNQISKNIIGNTEEEIELREQLNETIDDQTEALREQGSEFNAGKDRIGEYTDGINRSDLSLRGFIEKSQEAGGSSKLLAGGLSKATKGFLSMTKAALKFLLTPVGIILAAIAGAFLLIKNAMDRSEESTTKIRKAFAGFSGMLKGLMKILGPIGDFLIDGLVKGFELVEKGISKALAFIEKALDRLGFDKAAEKFGNFTEKIEEAAAANKTLTQAELELQKAQRKSRLIQLQFQKDAEKLRQIRDDENKSIQERIRANEELGAVLRKQSKEELDIAQKALELAELRIELEGENTEALDERAAALTEIADIEERITGQESEQLVNRVALQKEAADAKQEIEEEAAKKSLELAQKKAEESVDLAQFELNEYIRANESKLESDKFLTEEAVKEEKRRRDLLAEQRRNFAATELEKGAIDQIEYNEKIAQINQENQEVQDGLDAERKEALKVQQAVDFENKLEILKQQGISEFELINIQLERGRQAELESAEKTGANKKLIDQKYANFEKLLQADLTAFKNQQNQDILAGVRNLFGESSLIGKAFAIAEITNTTAINAAKAFAQAAVYAATPLTLPLALNANIQGGIIIASGAAQIAKTAGIKFSKGDILKGRSHTRGGIPFSIGGRLGFEAEGGEALINKKSTSMFAPLLSAINIAGGGKRFAGGSILGGSSVPASPLIDYDILALKVAEANASLPNPIVSVEEINTVAANVEAVENLAST